MTHKVLITGATGNVGLAVLEALQKMPHTLEVNAGVRDMEKDKAGLSGYQVVVKDFDFEKVATYRTALNHCDILFLLRPPQLADVGKYFAPLISIAKDTGVKHIVFLSVQGVEKSKIIPHHKIEKLIVESRINYTFLRPAYFMQNFNTTLREDLIKKRLIFLPAGKARFTIIDVRDIGEVAAKILTDVSLHINKSYELTNTEKLTFGEMAEKLSEGLQTKISYKSPNLISFFLTKRKEKVPAGFILVMIMLHYFPRFQKEPDTTEFVQHITGKKPFTFDGFIRDNRKLLT
jgi:uncharacterized protein YbjT (DUF2867 family)